MTYRIGSIVTVAGSGTITSTGVNLAGSGSNFGTVLSVGDVIQAAGQSAVIASITSNTVATTEAAFSPALAGATWSYSNMAPVSTLTADAQDPLGSYYRWVETKPLANGLERALGRSRAIWLWKNIGVNLRTSLKVYCPGKSARVYICTLADPSLNTFATYQASLLWPDTDNLYTPEFSINFKDLIAI